MKRLAVYCLPVILVLIAADRAFPQTTTYVPINSHAAVTTTLPFRLYWGYLVIVEGSIGDRRKLAFLVDTGANPSAVDQKIARSLRLAEQPARVNLSNTSVQTPIAVLPSLRVGPLYVESLPVLTEDLSFYQKALGQEVDAIVGMDVLRKSSFSINYKAKEMLFGPIGTLQFAAPFDTELPVVTIQMELQARQVRVVIDTGTPDLMLLKSHMSGLAGFRTLGTEEVSDVSGSFRRTKVQIPDVYLGQARIGQQVAFVVADRKDEGDYFDGVLGFRGTHFRKIAFDFEHHRFSWER